MPWAGQPQAQAQVEKPAAAVKTSQAASGRATATQIRSCPGQPVMARRQSGTGGGSWSHAPRGDVPTPVNACHCDWRPPLIPRLVMRAEGGVPTPVRARQRDWATSVELVMRPGARPLATRPAGVSRLPIALDASPTQRGGGGRLACRGARPSPRHDPTRPDPAPALASVRVAQRHKGSERAPISSRRRVPTPENSRFSLSRPPQHKSARTETGREN